jgi:ATP-dependent DNA helicase DinG
VNENNEDFNTMSEEINQWIGETVRGERSEMPTIPDRIWKLIGWNETMACDTCESRGFCKLVKAREHYRSARDLIIVDHDIFFHDLWSRKDRIESKLLPILPSYSAVIFDEGHKILIPAAMEAGQYINKEEMENIIHVFEDIQGAREALALTVMAMEQAYGDFFAYLEMAVIGGQGYGRQMIRTGDNLLKAAKNFHQALERMLLELEIEQGLYCESLPLSQIQAYEGQIERAIEALIKFYKGNSRASIIWYDGRDERFWVVPRNFSKMLNENLFQRGLPVIITSATLSNDGDFSYFMRSLGLKMPSRSTVGSPFDLEEQVSVYLTQHPNKVKDSTYQSIEQLVTLLNDNGGRALVLTSSQQEARKVKRKLMNYQLPFDIMCEDEGDRGYLVRRFREEETSVLIGSNFWEGIDVPGDALTLIAIWQLPFPLLDPFIEVQRKEAKEQGLDPITTVDYPEMGLKLKQGCGRLIRREDDKGMIVILDSVVGQPWEKVVMGALPPRKTRK